MDIVIFLTLALSTWRISHLLASEEGPAAILSTLRYGLGVRYNPKPPYEAQGKNVLSKMIICVWCNSVYVGLSWSLLYMIYNPLWLVALPFALSAGAIIINERIGEKED
jgi:hypothetical protein